MFRRKTKPAPAEQNREFVTKPKIEIRLRRGPSDLASDVVLGMGEFFVTMDSFEVYCGDGKTPVCGLSPVGLLPEHARHLYAPPASNE